MPVYRAIRSTSILSSLASVIPARNTLSQNAWILLLPSTVSEPGGITLAAEEYIVAIANPSLRRNASRNSSFLLRICSATLAIRASLTGEAYARHRHIATATFDLRLQNQPQPGR